MLDVLVRVSDPIAVASDTPAEISFAPGGSAANTAAWLGSLGAPTAFVGCVGDDSAGRDARQALLDAGVDARLVTTRAAATGTCVVLVDRDGERTMLPDAGANAHLAPDDLSDDLFVPGGHLHVSGYAFVNPGSRAAALAALSRACETGVSTSLDPASAAPLARLGGLSFLGMTSEVETVVTTIDEAEVLCGSRDADTVLGHLLDTYHDVVMKLGEDGAAHRSRSTSAVRVPAAHANTIVDTTGAGDAFAAGWLDARRRGLAVEAALAAACALGARACEVRGARPVC